MFHIRHVLSRNLRDKGYTHIWRHFKVSAWQYRISLLNISFKEADIIITVLNVSGARSDGVSVPKYNIVTCVLHIATVVTARPSGVDFNPVDCKL